MKQNINYMQDDDEQLWDLINQNLEYGNQQLHYYERQSPIEIDFLQQKKDNYGFGNLLQNQSAQKSNVQATELIPEANITNLKKRADGKSKNFQQNLASYNYTNTPKILASKLNQKKPHKKEVKQVKNRLDGFLQKNKVKNSQLIILFIYLFFKFQNAQENHFAKMKLQLLSYLNKRNKEANAQIPEEKQRIKKKIQINKALVEKYFGGQQQQIEEQLIREVCGQLFTGRQKETIDKPLNVLMDLQGNLNKMKSQQTTYQIIQSFIN